jgi:Rrf2 family protein
LINSKLTVAIHVLSLLALQRDEPLSSDHIAASVNTNAVVVRRILGFLRKAGYVESREGAGGGWKLARAPEQITLWGVLNAVQSDTALFELHPRKPNPACKVGRNIQTVLVGIYGQMHKTMERQLARTTIAVITQSIRKADLHQRRHG